MERRPEQTAPIVETIEAQPLNYATPEDVKPSDDVLRTLRRVVFAIGLGVLCAGVGTAWSPGSNAPGLMGFGGGLVGLTIPFPCQRHWR